MLKCSVTKSITCNKQFPEIGLPVLQSPVGENLGQIFRVFSTTIFWGWVKIVIQKVRKPESKSDKTRVMVLCGYVGGGATIPKSEKTRIQ